MQFGTDLVGGAHGEATLGHRREHRLLIRRLVQHPAHDARPPERRRDVRGDHEHRRAGSLRLPDRAQRVGRTRPGGHQRDAELPGRARVPVGGIPGRLLVPHTDQPDPGPGKRFPQRQVVHPGQPENDLGTQLDQRVRQLLRPVRHTGILPDRSTIQQPSRSARVPGESARVPRGSDGEPSVQVREPTVPVHEPTVWDVQTMLCSGEATRSVVKRRTSRSVMSMVGWWPR